MILILEEFIIIFLQTDSVPMSNSGISENMSKYLIVMCCFGMVLGKPKQNTKPERRCSNLGLKQRVEILEATLQGLPDIDDLRSRVENLEAALQVLTDFEDLPRRVEVLENYLSKHLNLSRLMTKPTK